MRYFKWLIFRPFSGIIVKHLVLGGCMSKEPTKFDVQYEKRIVMTAIILNALQNKVMSIQDLKALKPSHYNYAFNDAIKYLESHNFIAYDRQKGMYGLL